MPSVASRQATCAIGSSAHTPGDRRISFSLIRSSPNCNFQGCAEPRTRGVIAERSKSVVGKQLVANRSPARTLDDCRVSDSSRTKVEAFPSLLDVPIDRTRTRTRTNTHPYDSKNSARACAARNSKAVPCPSGGWRNNKEEGQVVGAGTRPRGRCVVANWQVSPKWAIDSAGTSPI